MQVSIKRLSDYKKIASQTKRGNADLTAQEIERLRLEKERLEKERVRREVLDKICEQSDIDISPDLIAREQGMMLDNLKQQVSQAFRISFEDYLKRLNKTEKELLDSLAPEAKKRLAGFLVMQAIAVQENISVSEEEINKESDAIANNFPDAKNVDQSQLREYTKNIIRNEKVFQFLENL